jgi:hypothetical protein
MVTVVSERTLFSSVPIYPICAIVPVLPVMPVLSLVRLLSIGPKNPSGPDSPITTLDLGVPMKWIEPIVVLTVIVVFGSIGGLALIVAIAELAGCIK